MKSIYNAKSGCLSEQPERFVPQSEEEVQEAIWEHHHELPPTPKKLRTIPCAKNNWIDGQELEEGKDYMIEKQFLDENDTWRTLSLFTSAWDDFNDEYRRLLAVPLPPPQDETFEDFIREAMDNFVKQVAEQGWSTKLRVTAEDILIAYDQMREKLFQK